MRKSLNLLIVFNCFVIALYSQSPPPPPPPPLIYSAPQNSEISEFNPENKIFAVDFPGKPAVKTESFPNGSITTYSVYRKGSNSIVGITEFNGNIEDKKEDIYEVIKKQILKDPTATIEKETEIETSGKSGREFYINMRMIFRKLRVFVVEDKIFEISNDVTNWHIINEKTKNDYLNETERFFDSFVIQKIILEPPVGFLGTVSDTNYKNEFFGFNFDFPSDWTQTNVSDIEKGKKFGLELLKTDKEKVNKAFEDSVKQEILIFSISQKNIGNQTGTNLGIGILKQPKQATSEMVAETSKNFFLTNSKIKLIKAVENVQINKIKFSTFTIETTIEDLKFQQQIWLTMMKGYSVNFVLTYRNSDGQKTVEDIFKNTKFNLK